MKLYFVRHGHNDAGVGTTPNSDSGEIDEPLNEIGITQARKLAEELKDVAFDSIISSTLKRAYQTADIVNNYHELPLEINADWRERETGGIYAGKERWDDMFDFDKDPYLEGGESLQDFIDRIVVAIDELRQANSNKTVMVVSHAGVHDVVYSYANRIPLVGNIRIDRPLENCEYRIYDL